MYRLLQTSNINIISRQTEKQKNSTSKKLLFRICKIKQYFNKTMGGKNFPTLLERKQ